MRNAVVKYFFILCFLVVVGACVSKENTKKSRDFLDLLDDPDWVISAEKINKGNEYFIQNKMDIQCVPIVYYNERGDDLKSQLNMADNIARNKIIAFLQNDIEMNFYDFKKKNKSNGKVKSDGSVFLNNSIKNFYIKFPFKSSLIKRIIREKVYQSKDNNIYTLMTLKYNDIIEYIKKQKINIVNEIKNAKYDDLKKNDDIKLLNNFIKEYSKGNV